MSGILNKEEKDFLSKPLETSKNLAHLLNNGFHQTDVYIVLEKGDERVLYKQDTDQIISRYNVTLSNKP